MRQQTRPHTRVRVTVRTFVYLSLRVIRFLIHTRERVVLLLALLSFAVTLLAVPWETQHRYYTNSIPESVTSFAPLWDAPSIRGTVKLRVEVLLVEWFAIAVFAAGVLRLIRRPRVSPPQ